MFGKVQMILMMKMNVYISVSFGQFEDKTPLKSMQI